MRKFFFGALAFVVIGLGVAFGAPALASTSGGHGDGGYPTPTPSVTVTQPTPTPTPPVVNPFANCRFTRTIGVTFDPQFRRTITRVVPAIVCGTPRTGFTVYDLVR